MTCEEEPREWEVSETGVKALNRAGATGPPNNTKEAPQLFIANTSLHRRTVFCSELPDWHSRWLCKLYCYMNTVTLPSKATPWSYFSTCTKWIKCCKNSRQEKSINIYRKKEQCHNSRSPSSQKAGSVEAPLSSRKVSPAFVSSLSSAAYPLVNCS